jgi:predicted hydrocarbon binding protein
MAKKHLRKIEELGRNLDKYARQDVRKKVLEGSEKLASVSDTKQIALWVKGAMERLDKLVANEIKTQVMEQCGRRCAEASETIEIAVAKRKKYKNLDQFLEAEKRKLLPGMRLEREGKILYQYYMPHSFSPRMRCFCSLLERLPAEENISPTYCQCSKGFVLEMWERILRKPVKVDVMATAVTGAKECKFKISQ